MEEPIFPHAIIDTAFSAPFYGLELLDDAGKESYAKMIKSFKEIVPNQPPFLIKKESWNRLAEGMHPDGTDWKNSNYEVYAFVFCVAFDQRYVNKTIKKLGKNKAKSKPDAKPESMPSAYFRVRTLLKDRNENTDGRVPVLVETERIAYVSLDIALKNQTKPREEWEDCLKFNTVANSPERVKVDNEVIVHPLRSVTERNPFNKYIPLGFQDPKPEKPLKYNSIIQNEGCIFGKQGIWNKLLSPDGKYNFQNDTLISLALDKADEKKYIITFNFKINDEYGMAGIDCPNPPVCPKE